MYIFKNDLWIKIAGWLILAIVLLLFIPMLYPAKLPIVYHFYHLILFVVLFGVYYLNTQKIIPSILKKRINFYYVIVFFGICALVINLMRLIETEFDLQAQVYKSLYPNRDFYPEDHTSYVNYYVFFLTALVLMIGYINFLLKRWQKEENKRRQIKAEKIKAELENLKAQINPHFFFNSLNTIYALTHNDIGKSQKALLKLSEMMRYAMNEENKKVVSLREETAFIQNYLELMHYRLPKNVQLSFELTQQQQKKKIAPMILLSFVENCFKHGISTEKACFIKITTAFENNYFVLITENDWFPKRKNQLSKGIGIKNTKKRLAIIYEDAYLLEQKIKKNRFYSILKIKLP